MEGVSSLNPPESNKFGEFGGTVNQKRYRGLQFTAWSGHSDPDHCRRRGGESPGAECAHRVGATQKLLLFFSFYTLFTCFCLSDSDISERSW